MPVIATSGWPAQILPNALLVAASPASYLAALTLLTSGKPLANAWAFAAGWFAAVFGIFVVTYAVTSPSTPKAASATNSAASAVLGLAAIVASVVVSRKQRAAHGKTTQPKWLARLERIRPVASFALGLFLPTYGLVPPAAIHLKEMHVSGTTAWAASITFGLVATLGVIVPAVLYAASTSIRARLRSLRDTAVANQLKIAAILLAVVGLSLLVSAITTVLSLTRF